MEEKQQRPETEASLHPQDAKEDDLPSSPEEKESKSIVTGETTTWNFSKELETHLQGEIEKQFAFEVKENFPASEENDHETLAVEETKQKTVSAEAENKTAEVSETSKDQEEAAKSQDEEKTEPEVAEKEEDKVAEQEGNVAVQKEEKVAEQKEPEEQAQCEQKNEPIQQSKVKEEKEELEKTVVLDLREEAQFAEQKQPVSQEETRKQHPFSLTRKKIFAAVAAMLLVAAGWIGISFASGGEGQASGQIFGTAPDQLIFQYEQKTFTFDLDAAGFDGKNPKTVNRQKLDKWIEEIRKQVERPARDANQERLGEPITPEQVGRKLDMNKLNQMLANFPALINKPQKLPVIEIQPKVTKADLEKVDQYLIGSYTTSLGNSSENRLTNIRLASKAIHNLILMPGEKFSFNKVVGKRTPERGYKKAGVIVKGEYSEGIGGGICQVSSTLYNSVDEAGLKILERRSHSAQVTYVPAGRDATVSWGGPDFRFKNNLDKPILIKIFIKDGRITVNTYTVPGTKVKQRHVPKAPGV